MEKKAKTSLVFIATFFLQKLKNQIRLSFGQDILSPSLAVNGYIDFTSFGSARFSLDFQHVSDMREYDVYGDVVTVEGCWVIPVSEAVPRGCELE